MKHKPMRPGQLFFHLFSLRPAGFKEVKGYDFNKSVQFFVWGVLPGLLLALIISFFRFASDVQFVQRFFWTALSQAGLFLVQAFFVTLLVLIVFTLVTGLVLRALEKRVTAEGILNGFFVYTPITFFNLSLALLVTFVTRYPLVGQIATALALLWSFVIMTRVLMHTTKAHHAHVEVAVFLGALLSIIVLVIGYVIFT